MRLEGKVTFITGVGTGQGRAACRIFAKEGAKIIGVDINEKEGRDTLSLVTKLGGDGIFVRCDVSIEKDVKNAIDAGVRAFGKLHILYNNAGVLWRDKDFEVTRIHEVDWDRVMAINLKGPVWVCKYGIPKLIKAGGGSIINVGSCSALLGFTKAQDAYTSSKGALASLTRSVAIFYAKHKVRANIIHPGPVDTPMQKEWDNDTKKAISEMVPLGRLGTAEDIAYCALFLATEESSFITGQEIIIDGGIMVNGG